MRWLRRTDALVCVFLAAAVAANLAVAAFGQVALIFTAWILIPFDLVTRDVLHEKWKDSVMLRMTMLILAGGFLTAIVSPGASRVAVASVCAFVLAGSVNALGYHLMRERSRLVRMNVSNFFAAITDSMVFPVIAFKSVDASLCAGQAASKFSGGIIWSFLFVHFIWRKAR